MYASHKNKLVYLAVIAGMACVFWAMAACAGADPMTESVSLSGLAAPMGAGAMPRPSTPFAPTYFGANSVNGAFPANGNDYVKGGGPATATTPGLIGRGPHGGYDTTTYKCGVCHSGHTGGYRTDSSGAATSASADNHLLRTGMTGCEYCHVGSTGFFVDAKVYTSNSGNVSDLGPDNSGHAISDSAVKVPASDKGMMTLSCTSCHSVHGTASNWMPTDFYTDGSNAAMDSAKYGYKLLLANPGKNAAPVPNKPSTTVSDVGADPAAVNQFSFSIWCASCHNKTSAVQDMAAVASMESTFTASVTGGVTHTTDTISTGSSGASIPGPHDTTLVGIGMGALQCYTCHRGGDLSAASPMISDPATLAQLNTLGYKQQSDATCSVCHYGAANFATDPANLSSLSDWPHSSRNDVAMLGNWTVDFADLAMPTVTDKDDKGDPLKITTANAQELVCGRCHVVLSKDATQITFALSPHSLSHSYPFNPLTGLWATSGTVGSTEATYSPGYSPDAGK
ncbi:MAG: hypothetical protein FWC54_02320 [Actinomycetia bacterium]|nr:hypothetical protein [Actinomycetes bacterium]